MMNITSHVENLKYVVLGTTGVIIFFAVVIRPLFYLFPLYMKYIKNREVDVEKRILTVKEYVSRRFGVEQESIIVEYLENISTSKLKGFYEYMTKKEESYRVFCEHGEFIFKMDMYDGNTKLTDAKMVSDTNFKDALERVSD
ncbi:MULTISPECIES: hypothetical protein [Bacillus cereus group]|uniref:Uncharacterized protein n=1 Tax=Bacillus thuringiensis TaxID=1428 RepID=A0A9X6VC99_BACTU|nr:MULTISPECIES: hypothetical protein [Bacillus cereus group]MEC3269850.1 hypothetical protein [Bacillus thuringiensis]PFB07919.1 hypothetical protein CN398_09285 [Bacillus thuringiensis]